MEKFIFTNKTAIVTGGTAGIGLATVRELAKRGCNIAIIGRNPEMLANIPAELIAKYPKQKFISYKLDLLDINAVPTTIKQIAADFKSIDLLINNAGAAMAGKFEELSIDDIDSILNLNFRAEIIMAREVLPYIKKSNGGHIANVSSLFGLITPAGQSAYCASKFAVRGFSEVLRQEMKQYNIGVSTIFPGGVKTNIAANAKIGSGVNAAEAKKEAKKFESNLTMTPEYAANVILNGIAKRKPLIMVGSTTKFLHFMSCIMPVKYEFLLKMIK